VLKSLHSVDVSDILNVTLNSTTNDGVYNVKSHLMRLLANLVYQHPTNQHMVKLLDLYVVVMRSCENVK